MHSDGLHFCLRAFTLRFPAGEKKKRKCLSHFISSIKKKKEEKKNPRQTSSQCRKWHKVWQGSLSAAVLMFSVKLSLCTVSLPFQDDLRVLRAASFQREEEENITVEIRMCSDVNLWCRLNLWVNIKKEGSYNLLCSSFCLSVSMRKRRMDRLFLCSSFVLFSFHVLFNICQRLKYGHKELISFSDAWSREKRLKNHFPRSFF